MVFSSIGNISITELKKLLEKHIQIPEFSTNKKRKKFTQYKPKQQQVKRGGYQDHCVIGSIAYPNKHKKKAVMMNQMKKKRIMMMKNKKKKKKKIKKQKKKKKINLLLNLYYVKWDRYYTLFIISFRYIYI
jgi:hypothetical protein